MPLIIDAYNVLHERDKPAALAGLDEASLCAALGRSAFRSQGVTVVFDGQPKPLDLSLSPAPGIELVYSGPRRTADNVIITMIDADTAPRRLMVVSSDREIRKAARRRRATSWSSAEFLSRLAASPGDAPGIESKPGSGGLSEDEVQHWLEQFDLDDTDGF